MTAAGRQRTQASHADPAPKPRDRPARDTAGPGNQAMQHYLAAGTLRRQAVGGADDPVEREADRMAARALAGGRACSCAAGGDSPCPKCRAAALARRKSDGRAGDGAGTVAPLTGGRPLGRGERSFFEPRLGADFSGVRLHTDEKAAATADSVHARAFAIGQDIAFARGSYQPQTGDGRRLLAHELAHVALGHTGMRRQDADERPQPSPSSVDYDPCAIDVTRLNNRELLQHFTAAENYLNTAIAEKRRGEDQYYDYANLYKRALAERNLRVAQGHAWLNAKISEPPANLYRLEPNPIGDLILIYRVGAAQVTANAPTGGGIIVTPEQLSARMAEDNIPTVDFETYFGLQDPDSPQRPWPLQPPARPTLPGFPAPTLFDPNYPFGIPVGGTNDPRTPSYALGPFGMGGAGFIPPRTGYLGGPFVQPVVTAGPFGFQPNQVAGFQSDWRGDIGEALYAGRDPQSLASLQDLNLVQQNFTLYDFYDPRVGTFESVKTQLPFMPGGTPDLGSYQTAVREVLGSADPVKRMQALQLLRQSVAPNLTMDQMLLQTRFAVNPETVPAAQDSIEAAIRRGQLYYEPFLSAMLRQQPISIQHRNGTTVTYNDFAQLHADFKANLMTEARYRAAVAQMAQQARSQVVSTGAGAETHLRPLVDLRQRYDFITASDFANIPDTPAGRRQANAMQRAAFEKIWVPELLDVQTSGLGPVLNRSGVSGAKMGAGTTAVLTAPGMIRNWDTDPYAGRRYLTNVALSGAAGYGQATAEQYLRIRLSQAGLDMAAARAAAGESIAPLTIGVPASRLAGGSVLGGAAAGGVTLASMWMDERFFGADYTTIDYTAKTTRAVVIGTGASLFGALTAGATTAALAGGGGAAGCTVVVPLVGTVACGVVGGAAGFVAGVGSYILFDWLLGDPIESEVREVMGEEGCTD